jgi:hypothetical protein
MQIEPYNPGQLEAVIQLSLRAWEPVFDSLQNALNAEVYGVFYPAGWRVSQQKAVETVCAAEDIQKTTWAKFTWLLSIQTFRVAASVAH